MSYPLPTSYMFPSWKPIVGLDTVVSVAIALEPLAKAAGGRIPENLDDERHLLAFASSCGFPVTDPDIESAVEFPNFRYASRAWVRTEFGRFRAWCAENGWVTDKVEAGAEDGDGTEAPTQGGKKKAKRPKGEAELAGATASA